MKDGRRNIFKIAGFVLIAAALIAIGISSWNLITTEINTQIGNDIVDKMLSNTNAAADDSDTAMVNPPDTATPQPGVQQAETTDAPVDLNDPFEPEPDPAAPTDPNTTKKPKGSSAAKPVYLGRLVFTSLGNRKVPVIEGADESNLGRGAVHHSRSSPAGGVGNCVIFGHRNTVFRGFGSLKDGDTIRLEVPGNVYSYRISSMKIVEPDDPAIFQGYDQKVMTLVTCYPFNYMGSAPQRYIVVCVLQ